MIDEAHERSVFTDILIGLLSRIVPLREKVCVYIIAACGEGKGEGHMSAFICAAVFLVDHQSCCTPPPSLLPPSPPLPDG